MMETCISIISTLLDGNVAAQTLQPYFAAICFFPVQNNTATWLQALFKVWRLIGAMHGGGLS
jgi:hypothetical protein